MQTIQVPHPDQHLEVILKHCHPRRYPLKVPIYAGDKAESLFFILKGSVTVLIVMTTDAK